MCRVPTIQPDLPGILAQDTVNHIRVEVPAQAQTVPRDHYRGRIGDGRGRVEIDTGSGGVRITRS